MPETPTSAAATEFLRELQDSQRLGALVRIAGNLTPLLAQAQAQTPEGCPGWKTSEFWLTLAASLIASGAALEEIIPAQYAVLANVILAVVYMVLRSWLKASASSGALGGVAEALEELSQSNFSRTLAGPQARADGAPGEPATGNVESPKKQSSRAALIKATASRRKPPRRAKSNQPQTEGAA